MVAVSEVQDALYPSRSGAGAQLGRQIYQWVGQPVIMLGVSPTGVEIAAHASKAVGAGFDVVVSARVRMEQLGVVGAVAEDADAVMDPEFQPRFVLMDSLNAAIDTARRAIKTERLLFRGQRPLRTLRGSSVVIIDGHVIEPWKFLAAATAVLPMEPERVLAAAPVSTQVVRDYLRAHRIEFICPSLLVDPAGHPKPFGDPQDPSAERLRSIVIAREAA